MNRIARRLPWTITLACIALASCGSAKMTPQQAWEHCAEQVDSPFDEKFTSCLEDNADTSDPQVREALDEMRGAHDQLEQTLPGLATE